MALSVRAVSTNTGTGTTATGNKPTGTVDGDFLIAYPFHDGATANLSSRPSGWATTQGEPAGSGKDFSAEMNTKVASGEGASWDWTWDTSSTWRVIVVAVQDTDTVTPLNTSHGEDADAVNIISIGIMTTTVDGCLCVWCGSVDASGGARTWTADGSPTEQLDSMQGQIHVGIYSETQASAGSITRALTVSGSAQYMVGFGIAIAPAAGAAAGQPTWKRHGGQLYLPPRIPAGRIW